MKKDLNKLLSYCNAMSSKVGFTTVFYKRNRKDRVAECWRSGREIIIFNIDNVSSNKILVNFYHELAHAITLKNNILYRGYSPEYEGGKLAVEVVAEEVEHKCAKNILKLKRFDKYYFEEFGKKRYNRAKKRYTKLINSTYRTILRWDKSL